MYDCKSRCSQLDMGSSHQQELHTKLRLICIHLRSNTSASRYLGMASTAYDQLQKPSSKPIYDYKSRCNQLDVLSPHQQELCTKSKHILDVVADGASMGIEMCQMQFRDRRWNCSTFNSTDVFGKVLQLSKCWFTDFVNLKRLKISIANMQS